MPHAVRLFERHDRDRLTQLVVFTSRRCCPVAISVTVAGQPPNP